MPYVEGQTLRDRLLGHRDEAVSLLGAAFSNGVRPGWVRIDRHGADWASLRGYPPFEELVRIKG